MSKKLMTVNWEDLKVGDTLTESNAVVTEIWPSREVPCYELITEEKTIIDDEVIKNENRLVISEDHLFAIDTLESFDLYETTRLSKEQTKKQCINWICAKDAFNIFKIDDKYEGKECAEVKGINGNNIKIVPYKNLEPQKCNCITTTLGTFTINGIVCGNTARGSHSLDSMRDIVYNLINVAGMSEEWVSANLYLDLESIKRMQQLSGLKASFNDIDQASMAWRPQDDDSYKRKMTAYLTREASKYVENYRSEHPEAEIPTSGTALEIALDLGFDQQEVMKQHADEINAIINSK